MLLVFYASGGGFPENPDLPGPTGLMDRLTDATPQYGMDTVFLSNSGAEAVENAIKICYDHTKGKYGVTTEGAFHGRTLGALSLNRSKAVYRRDYPEIPSVHTIPFCDNRNCGPETCSCGFFTGESTSLERMVGPGGFVDPDDVAYLILEPIQGEAEWFPSREWLDSRIQAQETHYQQKRGVAMDGDGD